jgi:hypothetical protein
MRFFVTWEIEIDADSAEDAARRALAIQRDPASLATVFGTVSEDGVSETVDVTELDDLS